MIDNDRTPIRTRLFVLPETTALVVIGSVDLLTTLYWVGRGDAYEANYLFNIILKDFGPLGFIIAKALLLAIPLTVAELARKQNERFVKLALRICIILYVGLYIRSFVLSNLGLTAAYYNSRAIVIQCGWERVHEDRTPGSCPGNASRRGCADRGDLRQRFHPARTRERVCDVFRPNCQASARALHRSSMQRGADGFQSGQRRLPKFHRS